MKLSFLILCLLMVILSCKSEVKQVTSDQDSDVKTTSILDTLSLKLNANEKWLANAETHEGVLKMDAIISEFKRNKVMDYKGLGETLSKQTSYIIKNCSMKGEPHDQLHVVLIPMLDEISILREEDHNAKSERAVENLEALIQAYFEHFQL